MKPIPDGYATVTPWLISHDTPRLIDYVTEAFGAVELGRVTDADGRVEHAEIRIGDSVVMLFDAAPGWPPTPGFLRLYVKNADETHRRAVAAGGTSVTEVTHLFFGDRVGRVRDPLGNVWWIQARVEEVSAEEMQRRLADPVFIAAMRYLQGADLFGPGPARDPRQSAGQVAGAPLTSPVSRLSRVSHRQVRRSPWPFIVADSGSVVDPVYPSTPDQPRSPNQPPDTKTGSRWARGSEP